jgi:hypothetical protein
MMRMSDLRSRIYLSYPRVHEAPENGAPVITDGGSDMDGRFPGIVHATFWTRKNPC